MSLGIYTKQTKKDFILPKILHQSQDKLRKMAYEEELIARAKWEQQERERIQREKELSDAQYRTGTEAEVPERYKRNFERRIGSYKTLKTMRHDKDPGRATGLIVNVDLFEQQNQSEAEALVPPAANTLYTNQQYK